VTTPLDLDSISAQFLNRDFDERHFRFTAQQLVDYASCCGETAPRYTDPDHPDFQASPTLASCLQASKRLPDGFPELPGLGMDAGKAVMPAAPIRANVDYVGRTHLHEVYAKTGRSGRMVFLVLRMDVYDPDETHVASADTRIVVRERPQADGESP